MKKSLLFLLGIIAFLNFTNAQWVAQDSKTTANLNSVCFLDSLHGWAVGNLGNIIHTVDGGKNWTSQISGVTENLYSVSFYDGLNGYAVGNNSADNSTVLQTTDGGMNWTLMTLGDGSFISPLYSVQFTNSTNGWIVGGDTTVPGGSYFKFDGTHWYQGTIQAPVTPVQVYSFDPNNVYMLTNNGAMEYNIFKSTAGGPPFTQQPLLTNVTNAFTMININSGWAVGNGGFLNYDGTHWNVVNTSFDDKTFYSVIFKNAKFGYAVGSGGTIVKYNGTTWKDDTSHTTTTLRAVCFSDTLSGWAVGNNGVIMHKAPHRGSDKGVKEIHQSVFKVQTYPNPCKDKLTLSYKLSENINVSIKLFDLTGSEISTLLNDKKVKGDYTLNIDAENLKSGVYFCKIQAGQYSEITKIMVVK